MSDPVEIRAADGAFARIHPRGAHLTYWQPAGCAESRLFLSEHAIYAEGIPIRGGVPVIFPQFASEGPLPKHGFARTASWHLLRSGNGEAVFSWQDDAATRVHWPHSFAATLTVQIGGNALTVRLGIRNTGEASFPFTAALHTYLAVDDIAAVRLSGLRGCRYCDTAGGGALCTDADEAVAVAGEVDRNYFATPGVLMLRDGRRETRIEQQGFADTVVWNPGAATSAQFKDLAPDAYRRFLCVEAAVIEHPIWLAPGAEWQGQQRLTA